MASQIGFLIAAILLSEVVAFEVNPLYGPTYECLEYLGASRPSSVKSGEIYRLFLGFIIPTGAIQLGINLIFLMLGCMRLEYRIGWRRAALIYIAGGIVGNIASCIFTSSWLHASSSPSVIATSVSLAIHHLHGAPSKLVRARETILLIVTITFIALLGLLPGSNNWANIAGLFTGILLSVWMLAVPHYLLPAKQLPWGIIALILWLTASGVLFAVFFFFVEPEHPWCSICTRMTCVDLFEWCGATEI
jgi:rhomboid protease GluP